jgi:signal transduction histidine kinase
MPTNNIYLRIFWPFSTALVLVTLLAWWLATSLLAAALERRLEQQMEHAGRVLAAGEFPLTRELLLKLSKLLQVDIILLGADGAGLSTLAGEPSALTDAVLAAWAQAGSATHRLALNSKNIPYRLVIQPLPGTRDAQYAAVALLASLGDVRAAARRAAGGLGLAAFGSLLALAWTGHRIARSITAPIQELAAMAARLTAGDREVRSALRQANEIGVLAQALNKLAERLSAYEAEVAEHSRLAAIGQTAARIAHEIRNPLTALNLQLQLLHEAIAPEHQALTHSLLDEIRRLELIVGSTLALSRPLELTRQSVDLNRLIGEVAQVFTAPFAHRGIHLKTRLAPALPALQLDPNRIKQLLVNLLVNASDELPDGGLIRLDTGAQNGEIGFGVADSGPGIAPERRAALFAAGHSRKPDGLGLGLPLCQEIAARHGGRIEVTNSDLGGAWFRVWLPSAANPS